MTQDEGAIMNQVAFVLKLSNEYSNFVELDAGEWN
jgi:hypothetical protein